MCQARLHRRRIGVVGRTDRARDIPAVKNDLGERDVAHHLGRQFDAAKFDLEKKTATLTITQEVFKTIPTYTVTTYPQFYTPTYRTDIYKVYGLTPRELRRIERRVP